jgi:hypothetical protein
LAASMHEHLTVFRRTPSRLDSRSEVYRFPRTNEPIGLLVLPSRPWSQGWASGYSCEGQLLPSWPGKMKPLFELSASSECLARSSGRFDPLLAASQSSTSNASSLGFRPYSAPRTGNPLLPSRCQRLGPTALRVSHPLDGLVSRLPEPCGLISCRTRSWG